MAKQPEDHKPKATSAKAWKKTKGGPVELTLPSGNVCLAKRPGMDLFLRQGRIPNALMPIIQTAIEKAQGGKPLSKDDIDLRSMMNDPEKMASVMKFSDDMVIEAVKQPRVFPVPDNEDDRDEDELYIDEVDEEDKAFIFQWAVGGSADVAAFHQGLSSNLADLATEQEMEQTTF